MGDRYDYDERIGGVAYFFLRGVGSSTRGLHFIKPDRAMIEALDRLFEGDPSKEAGHVA
jgi:exodeoxyribonuclease V beta subunit